MLDRTVRRHGLTLHVYTTEGGRPEGIGSGDMMPTPSLLNMVLEYQGRRVMHQLIFAEGWNLDASLHMLFSLTQENINYLAHDR